MYDTALRDKLKEVFDNVIDASEDKALQLSEDGEALVKLPLVSIWRLNNNLSQEVSQFPLKEYGRRTNKRVNNAILTNYELTFDIEYQIDVWSDRRSECDDLFSELLLFLLREPNINITDINTNITYDFPLQITETNTSVELSEFSEKGNLYRQVITIKVPNAVVTFPTIRKPIFIRIVKMILENYKGDTFDI